eukprot:CFRG3612T1
MSDSNNEEPAILLNLHKKFFLRCLKLLPEEYTSVDCQRMTIAFFAISGLDMLGALDDLDEQRKRTLVEWVYAHQLVPDANNSETSLVRCGFRGSMFLGIPFCCTTKPEHNDMNIDYDCAHIAMTYCAILLLLVLGDDLSRVQRKPILNAMKKLQKPDGSYFSSVQGSESDVRFVYCAAAISHALKDWSGMDRDLGVKYIKSSMAYDFGIGQAPGLEGHGGSTFCAVAALALMDRLDDLGQEQTEGLVEWLIKRQHFGFEGRPNKITDSCYSFWIGGALKILEAYHYIDAKDLRKFLSKCQFQPIGGFSKYADPECPPDVLHTYFSVCALSLMGEDGIKPMNAALNISFESAQRVHSTQFHS